MSSPSARARKARAHRSRRERDGQPLGPLAGVPFAVKNLFDVDGPADARRLQDQPRACRPPRATRPLIERLEAAGAVLVGALNMGEYAYDFTGENVHDGAVAQSARSRPA